MIVIVVVFLGIINSILNKIIKADGSSLIFMKLDLKSGGSARINYKQQASSVIFPSEIKVIFCPKVQTFSFFPFLNHI